MSLSRLWQKQGKTKEARKMLAEIYGWFSEGFDTMDLKEAKALLERILKRHDGNRTRAARELGIERNYLRRLIRRYGLK